ncbi:hypothetical protein NHP190012_16020 [Helicobacter sp. NHP19-012]|uniref:Uncharacterized protein n=1 Tax=Helicobacter gastrofelis TaxID=2849642 RepID=A0ABM7SGC4_9HELI|nr:hypothetical protein [Helicobacter sp. NHP19-012]BCZ19960.1 hypothetical protein NHP190012_16020 [Helicobacter sp. NHP19-012]
MDFSDSQKAKEALLWKFLGDSVIFKEIISFKDDIVAWFKSPERLHYLQKNKKVLAVSIKEKLSNENYGIINCLFNIETEEIDGKEALGIQGKEIDEDIQKNFGDKDMIVLK